MDNEEKSNHTKMLLACSYCYTLLRKFNKGEFTISQICQHFKKGYDTTYFHIAKLSEAGLIEDVKLGITKPGKYKRRILKISSSGKMALMEKGDIDG